MAKDGVWTEDELRASVNAYREILQKTRRGEPFVKKEYFRELATRFGRSPSAFEYRMQNISFVMGLMGRDWIKGLPPAKNVGTNVAATIERLINEADGQHDEPRVPEALAVAKERKGLTTPPAGNMNPAQIKSITSSYARDQRVKAWVLERSNGRCEACAAPAPFATVDGFPYLEVHHVRKLADGGSDTPSNAVALCPNCHRRLHFSIDALVYRESLYAKLTALSQE